MFCIQCPGDGLGGTGRCMVKESETMARNGNAQQRFQQWMYGRNGLDDMARAFIWIAIAFMVAQIIVSFFSPWAAWVLSLFSFAALVYCFWRVLSKNLAARRNENSWWVTKTTPIIVKSRRRYSYLKEWKRYHRECRIFVCDHCGQTLRVPKGKGKIRVTCPKCKTSFIAKS